MNSIDASLLAGMFLAGAKRLEANKDIINELNVFPVPDGDTGTNMSMTVRSAADEVRALDNPSIDSLCKAISSGSLRGARGNSGVILSQILRGFTKVIRKEEVIDIKVLSEALQKATETAYRAVMKPKEGTMLTVIKGISNRANEIADTSESIESFVSELTKRAEIVLKKTPDMLPVLKEAGVVDSGGQGLLEMLRGADDFINGRETDLSTPAIVEAKDDYKYLYEVSFNVLAGKDYSNQQLQALKVYLEAIGENVEVDSIDSVIKISISTNEPGKVLTKALKDGEITSVCIKNKKDDSNITENENKPLKKVSDPSTWKEMGFVSVSIGEGLGQIFKELGVDHLIEGGQTMNPSTEDILEAINAVEARNVFVLPNNKNILLAAGQAAELCEDKNVIVIPTTTLPHGITALINYIPEQSPEENKERMIEELSNVHPGEITYAVRNTQIDNKKIKAGDYMGIGLSGIISVNKNLKKAMAELIKGLMDEESSLLSVYYGADVSEKDAAAMEAYLAKTFPEFEIEMQQGGQPVYFYVLSVE